MAMAQIFKPLRWQAPLTPSGGDSLPPDGDVTGLVRHRENRMGTQSVTNTAPSGPLSSPEAQQAKEESWMTLLEIVFAETGWPDA